MKEKQVQGMYVTQVEDGIGVRCAGRVRTRQVGEEKE